MRCPRISATYFSWCDIVAVASVAIEGRHGMEDLMYEIGERIRGLREACDVSVDEMAE